MKKALLAAGRASMLWGLPQWFCMGSRKSPSHSALRTYKKSWTTGIEWDAKLLGFKLPKLVGAPALREEARRDRNHWPLLPQGTIDRGGPCPEPDEPWEKIIERRCRELSPHRYGCSFPA
jgi:hypothetical protein